MVAKKKTAKKEEHLEQLQRVQAEFENYRKRVERDRELHKEHSTTQLIRDILPILDNLTLAIEHAEKSELLEGVKLIREQLLQVLQTQGVEEIAPEGKFNPEQHEAIVTTEDKKAPGTIIKTFQRGYTRNGKVLRPAKVSVAKEAS